jgi:nitroreductase
VFWGVPAVVLICARSGNSQTPFDCCRAGQNLMLAAHARGLGSCWVGAPLPWLQSAGVAEELGLPEGYVPVVAMLLGIPAERPGAKSRPRPAVTWCSDRRTAED